MQHVYWLIPGRLAGRPGPACAPWDLGELWRAGLRIIITLDERGVDAGAVQRAGFVHRLAEQPAIELRTFTAQQRCVDGVNEVLPFIHAQVTAARPTLVHCWAGQDRTGATLACYLVRYAGLTADQAMARVRKVKPGAMASLGYTDVVDLFAWQEGESR